MTPLTPAVVTALAQQAAESPAHLDPVLVQQVCREWQIGQQAAALQRCIVEAAYQDKVKAEQQRDAALAKRDAAERNEREYRAACEMSICALRDSRERWEQRAVLAEAERDKARHMLTVYGCRDAAGHNEDDCPLCSAEHALLNTRESLTEARRVLRAQDECMVCKAELFRDLTVPHCFDCVVEDEHAEEWDAICAAKAAVLAQDTGTICNRVRGERVY